MNTSEFKSILPALNGRSAEIRRSRIGVGPCPLDIEERLGVIVQWLTLDENLIIAYTGAMFEAVVVLLQYDPYKDESLGFNCLACDKVFRAVNRIKEKVTGVEKSWSAMAYYKLRNKYAPGTRIKYKTLSVVTRNQDNPFRRATQKSYEEEGELVLPDNRNEFMAKYGHFARDIMETEEVIEAK